MHLPLGICFTFLLLPLSHFTYSRCFLLCLYFPLLFCISMMCSILCAVLRPAPHRTRPHQSIFILSLHFQIHLSARLANVNVLPPYRTKSNDHPHHLLPRPKSRVISNSSSILHCFHLSLASASLVLTHLRSHLFCCAEHFHIYRFEISPSSPFSCFSSSESLFR